MFERNRIAETLRNAREKQGMSLEQAAAAAGIPLQYVRLLEGESNVSVGVSDELYLIPFFRKYARFVGIDAEEMLPEFLGVVQQVPGEGSAPIRLAYRPRLGFLWRPLAVVATIAVAVMLMLRQAPERPTFDDEDGAHQPAIATEPSSEPADSLPTSSPMAAEATPASMPAVAASTSVGSPSPVASAAPSAAPMPNASITGAHELKINAIEEAWFTLALNDQPTKQYLLRAGESRTWSADHFTLTVGNAGGVGLALDGRDLPPIGRPGQVVRNVRLPTSAATPAAAPSPRPTAQ
jgi:cytoskeleton protein RodZ